jgi:hypothetical protein
MAQAALSAFRRINDMSQYSAGQIGASIIIFLVLQFIPIIIAAVRKPKNKKTIYGIVGSELIIFFLIAVHPVIQAACGLAWLVALILAIVSKKEEDGFQPGMPQQQMSPYGQ